MADIEFPQALRFLFEPARYKVAYGGRGGAKSWAFARALLIQGAARPLRILCAREIQKSINDSVHRLLSDQIRHLGLEGNYEILQTEIRGKNGTVFFFAGLRHNVNNIKSIEGIDIVWVEEAQSVSKSSWDTLIPTIRKDGSEVWISFNPELDTDETYKRFVKLPPTGAVVRKVTYKDNPWFTEVLRQEMEDKRLQDPDGYLHVWEGNCKQTLEGAIFANEIRRATEENRITRVPYVETHPVNTYWDLGYGDHTSIWFAQSIGHEFRIIDFYQNRLHKIQHYIQVLQQRGYVYGKHYLPHDAKQERLNAERTTEQIVQTAFGSMNVVLLPPRKSKDDFAPARTIFGQCWFDEDKCADGLQSLRRYRYDVDPETGQFSRYPLHDDASHAADAFHYLGMSIAGEQKKQQTRQPSLTWMKNG